MPPVWLSCVVLASCIGAELAVLFVGLPAGVNDVTVGRVLGTLDALALLVAQYNWGSSAGSARKTELAARSAAGAPAEPQAGQ